MSATPLTDAYLASRCKGENEQSWVEFARGLEEKMRAEQNDGLKWRLLAQVHPMDIAVAICGAMDGETMLRELELRLPPK